jgi:hypothetical protein
MLSKQVLFKGKFYQGNIPPAAVSIFFLHFRGLKNRI